MAKKQPTAQAAHNERGHAPLPPSASHRWLQCAPSQGYINRLISTGAIEKRKSGPSALRGTRIHEHGEQFVKWLLRGKKIEQFTAGEPDELAEARDYAYYVMSKRAELEQLHGDPIIGVEDRGILIPDVCWGSRDIWFSAGKHLCVVDLKTGREPVEVKGNSQLVIYAADIVEKYDPKTIELCVWQPNASDDSPPERRVVYKRAEYNAQLAVAFAGAKLAARWLEEKDGHEKHLVAGSHCGWCDALGVCPKAHDRASEISSKNFQPVPIGKTALPSPTAMGADQVAEILRRAPMFQKWLSAVQVRALELMSKNKKVPGFKVVAKTTRRAWESKYTDAQIARSLGIDIKSVTKTTRLSPAEIEKQLDAKGKTKLNRLVYKPEGAPAVVPESDRRAPLLATKINFTPVSNEEEDDD